ncbi:WD repeat-containing protein WRAP73 [Thraustotheca clavata]|uniref:WD repeat-containing protein WRAP73 n=1 Tax=Thraustotheca clavata TaxID=74557 RepID=A0A1V9ZCJ2_9STRA|nr:WD repeat-containing protein WRAP73 [Thraustotheca clavata]
MDVDGHKTSVSQLLPHSNGLLSWSSCGRYLAIAKDTRLSIRDADFGMSVVQVFTCVDMISSVQWAPHTNGDGTEMQLVLCAMYKRALVQVFSILDPSWQCKIAEGICGLIGAKWTPDTQHIITISDFRIHATVWSLVDTSKYVIRQPKLGNDGFTFSPDGMFLAVAERSECKDMIGIYNVDTWEMVSHFDVASYDLVEITWTMDGRAIFIRDTHLEYRFLLYSPDGTLLQTYEAYQNALGIKTVSWSPTGQLVAIGSYDEKVRVLSNLHWKTIAELEHPVTISSTKGQSSPVYINFPQMVFEEVQKNKNELVFLPTTLPNNVTVVNPDPLKELPRLGVGSIAWSFDAKILATRNDNMPRNIWLWKTETMELHAIIVLTKPVKSFRWSPNQNTLAFSSANNRVCLWSDSGITWIEVADAAFSILGLRWHPKNGNHLIAMSKSDFCCLQFSTQIN